MSRAKKRVEKELEKLRADESVSGLVVDVVSPLQWKVTFTMGAETVYSGETYTLKVTFDESYPMEAPTVVFDGTSPEHEHVYSNGHICLNILDSDWVTLFPSIT